MPSTSFLSFLLVSTGLAGCAFYASQAERSSGATAAEAGASINKTDAASGEGGGNDASVEALPRTGWTRMTGSDLHAVWGASDADIWAVGEKGTMRHFDGILWSDVPSGTSETLRAVSGSASNEVWAVGDAGTAIRWNGIRWQEAATGLKAKAAPGVTPALRGVWSRGASDAWAVGDAGTVLHWRGRVWEPVDVGAGGASLRAIGGNAGGALTVLSSSGAWRSEGGTTWRRDPQMDGHCVALWVEPRAVVFGAWAACLGYQGSPNDQHSVFRDFLGWKPDERASTDMRYAISGTGSDNVWTSGVRGAVDHFDGLQWTRMRAPTNVTLNGIWASPSGQAWAAGPAGTLCRFDRTQWICDDFGRGPQFASAVWGSASNDVWVAGESAQMFHWNGVRWHAGENLALTSPTTGSRPPTPSVILGLWGSASDDVWATSEVGDLLHWDGDRWSTQSTDPGASYGAVHGSGRRDAWIVAARGPTPIAERVMRHWDGRAWTAHAPGTTASLEALWVLAPNDAWAGGEDGVSVHWNGQLWQEVPTGLGRDETIRAAWGSATNNVWMATQRGVLIHWDGSGWARIPTPPTELALVTSLWASGPSELWVFGISRVADAPYTAMRWDGRSWSSIVTGMQDVRAAWSHSPSELWAVGSGVARFLRP